MSRFRKTADTFTPGQLTLPSRYYSSPEIFQKELARIFHLFPFCLGHVSQIPKPGEYFVINVFDESLIVLRDRGDQVRVFYNTCRHRGTRLCENTRGKFSGTIQCQYHAWTYDLTGELIGAPFMKEVPGFDLGKYPLKSLPVDLWQGFIFVNLSVPQYKLPTNHLKDLDERIGKWNIAGLAWLGRREYAVDSNWKYIFQNFNECYHCPTIHPTLTKITDVQSGHNDLVDGPVVGGYLELKASSMTPTGRACGYPLGKLGRDAKRAYYYSVLPNLLLNIHPDYVMFHLVFPISAGKSKVVSDWLVGSQTLASADFNPQAAVDFWHETNLQDWHICELSQLGVQSSGYEPGWYSPRESLLAAFDRFYLSLMK